MERPVQRWPHTGQLNQQEKVLEAKPGPTVPPAACPHLGGAWREAWLRLPVTGCRCPAPGDPSSCLPRQIIPSPGMEPDVSGQVRGQGRFYQLFAILVSLPPPTPHSPCRSHTVPTPSCHPQPPTQAPLSGGEGLQWSAQQVFSEQIRDM